MVCNESWLRAMLAKSVGHSVERDLLIGKETQRLKLRTATINRVGASARLVARGACVIDMMTGVSDSTIAEYYERYADCQ